MPEEEFNLGDDTITKEELSRSAPEKRVCHIHEAQNAINFTFFYMIVQGSNAKIAIPVEDKSFFLEDHVTNKETIEERSA